MKTDYVIFWADGHHPVRILPMRLDSRDLDLGSHYSLVLNGYCRHLQAQGLGQCIQWEASDDCKGSYPELLAHDLAAYCAWIESAAVPV